MHKKILITGAVCCLLTVVIGAFGSHLFMELLQANNRVATFDTAVRYQMFHGLGLILVGILNIKKPNKLLNYSAVLFFIGIILFSGSLYLLSLLNLPMLGAITPFGGLSFMAGWIVLIIYIFKSNY